MDLIESEAWLDVELHGRVMPMDCEDFHAHSVGFFKRTDQWMDWHPP